MKGELQLLTKQDLTLRASVFETLRSAILRGYFEPGEHLTEINLAEILGVSRTPIREALQILEREKLVTILPRRGAVVADISEENLKDEMEIRAALEILAVSKAAHSITEEQIREMEKIARDFEMHCRHEEMELCALDDERFHQVITDAARNKRLSYLMEIVREQLYRYRLESLKETLEYSNLIREHEEILQALREKDAAAGKTAVGKHITRQCKVILKNLNNKKTEEKK